MTPTLRLGLVMAAVTLTPLAAMSQAEAARATNVPETRLGSAEGRFNSGDEATTVTSLTVRQIPAGATVRISCTGTTCPFSARTQTYDEAREELQLASLFDRRELRPGTVIEVRITAPKTVGSVVQWEVRKAKEPSITSLCVRPGSTRPARC